VGTLTNPALSAAVAAGIVIIVAAAVGSVLESKLADPIHIGFITVPGVIILAVTAVVQLVTKIGIQELSGTGSMASIKGIITALLNVNIPGLPVLPACV
jgi:hypothetical protein